jgi:hypothetical protein
MPSPTSFTEIEMESGMTIREVQALAYKRGWNAALRMAAGICRERAGDYAGNGPTSIAGDEAKYCAQAIEARVTSTDPPPSPAYLNQPLQK